jgi:hypothetical protein
VELPKELHIMEAFILAGLLFHVSAAASLTLVSAISGLMDARRRAARAAREPIVGAAVIAMPSSARAARAPVTRAPGQSEAA